MSIGKSAWWTGALAAALACGGEEAGDRQAAADPDGAAAAVQDTRAAAPVGEDPRSGGVGEVPASGAAGEGGRETIVFLGTSLTAGLGVSTDDAWPALIATRIDSAALPFSVVNAGSSGETSAGALQRIEWVLRNRDPDVLVLETGANDGLRGLDVAGTSANIDSIIRVVRAARPEAAILLVQMEAPPNLGEAYTDAFRAMYPTLATRHGIGLMPFLLDGVAGVDSLNQGDGIHPNEAGHRVLASTVWQALRPVLAARSGGS